MRIFLSLLLVVPLSWCACVAEESGCGPFQYYKASLADEASEALEAAFANIDAWLADAAVALDAPSISFGVVYDQALVHYSSVGYTNLHSKEKPTPDSIYRIGSISKVWTVLLALKLRQQGIVSLEDPIAAYNSHFSIYNPWGITPEELAGKTITLMQLASQVSGLPRECPCEGLNECLNITTREILQRVSQQSLLHPTDVQPSYSNLAYAILGNVLSEYVGDKSFNHTLFQNIIEPMGLKHTGLYLNTEQAKYAATGYENGAEVDYVDIGWEGPCGQMFSSVNDLSALLMQYFAAYPSLYQRTIDKEYKFVVSPQSLREMMRPVFINPDLSTGFGSPWEIFMRHGHMIRSKGGNIDGFSSEIAMVPELKLGLVALFNCPGRETLLTTSALDILIPAFEGWVNEIKAKEFRAPPNAYYDNISGVYGVDGEALVRIDIDKVSGFPVLSCPELALHGLLTPMETKNDNTADKGTFTFVLNDLSFDAEYCFPITLDAYDGLTLNFVREQKGKYQAFRADGMVYGTEFVRMDKGVQPIENPKTSPSSIYWLRGSLQSTKMALLSSVEHDTT